MKSSSAQGMYLDAPSAASAAFHQTKEDQPESFSIDAGSQAIIKGEMQEPAYRDKWFGVAFMAHLGVMVTVAALFATGTIESEAISPTRRLADMVSNSNSASYGDSSRSIMSNHITYATRAPYQSEDYNNYSVDGAQGWSAKDTISLLSTLVICLVIAPILAVAALWQMYNHALVLIQGSLIFGIVLNLVVTLLYLIVEPTGAIVPAIFTIILACYAKAVWHRIPFAAANVRTAATVVKANLGMAVLSLAGIPLNAAWWYLWLYVTFMTSQSKWMSNQVTEVQVTDDTYQQTHEQETMSFLGVVVWMLLLVSFYWTLQVISNVIHTTVAGTVGTWWFSPMEASSCCSSGLTDSLGRSVTYSFGSICLGSLIVAILEMIKTMVRSASRNRRMGIFRCVAECLLVYIERLAEYFNRWAFVYVGLYGYSYLEAGKNVITLFKQRGWTTIITDSLTTRMIGMVCFVIGLLTALVAAILTLMETANHGVVGISAFCGLVLGILLSNIVFRALLSSVDSVIVLYAEAPNEFQLNHPQLAQEMQYTWAQAWPDIFSSDTSSGTTTTATATAV
jgi:hypothetical protein